MTRLFLIRHGEPEASWGGAIDDPGLSESGHGQALAACAVLREKPVRALLTSPMRRCLETAEPFKTASGLQPLVEPRVSEVSSPVDVADRRAWLHANFPWNDGAAMHWDEIDPGLSAWRDDLLSCVSALSADSAIFSHFVAINALVGAALGRTETIVFRPDYASITELALVDGTLHLVSLGDQMTTGEVR